MFKEYLTRLRSEFRDEELSYFELNLETWRQLWRVLEISDIICLIMDVRYAALHFPPPLFDFVQAEGKRIFLFLNKCDLVGEPTTTAWRDYFMQRFPGIEVFTISSFRTATVGNPASRRKHSKQLAVPVGLTRLVERWSELDLKGAEGWKRRLASRGLEGLIAENEEDEDEEEGEEGEEEGESESEGEGEKDDAEEADGAGESAAAPTDAGGDTFAEHPMDQVEEREKKYITMGTLPGEQARLSTFAPVNDYNAVEPCLFAPLFSTPQVWSDSPTWASRPLSTASSARLWSARASRRGTPSTFRPTS
jgi:hypothetical protein